MGIQRIYDRKQPRGLGNGQITIEEKRKAALKKKGPAEKTFETKEGFTLRGKCKCVMHSNF